MQYEKVLFLLPPTPDELSALSTLGQQVSYKALNEVPCGFFGLKTILNLCISFPRDTVISELDIVMHCTLPCLDFRWTAAYLLSTFPGTITGRYLWVGSLS